jgi:regulator of protease activity HflC (stomatin/prohibitin superfamily)
MSSSGASRLIGCGCCLAIVVTIIVLISLSVASLEQLDFGLNYNSITLTIEDKVYATAGLHFLGVGHYFITYPRTVQAIEFIAEENDRLQTRTSDGLPVSLSVSFQYRYDQSRLQELYLTFKEEQLQVYENTAKAVIANVATNFSAYSFFNDKQGIATEMLIAVMRVFDEQLFAVVEALQITRVELPSAFQNAILQSIEAKQNITQAQRYKENMEVTFQTQVLVANQTRQQTVALARGTAQRRLLQAEATARVTEQTVYAQMYAYGNLSAEVQLNTTESLTYIWWSEQESLSGKEFLVGLDPSAMIRSRS